jgi:LuxR family transcriptional regulator, maltose regulon positive regulatory protein
MIERVRDFAFAKTSRPELGMVASRESLFARLDGTSGRTVAWISGPAGAGKSTLAASFVEARAFESAWYQVDVDDNDVATFFHYLIHAARHLGLRPSELPALMPQHSNDVGSFSRRFFRTLFSKARKRAALVLDDLHELGAGDPLRTVLEAGLPEVAPGCCMIITSRSEPPASLARMRASGDLICLGAEDLRIKPAELAEIATLRGCALAPEAVIKLHERTQGWAAALVLVLEHAKLSGRLPDLPGDSTPSIIFDYLAGEIFDRFESRTQDFLLKVACLPRMTVGTAEAQSGEPQAERLLLNLTHNDYFVREVIADRSRCFLLHPLLRDFLKSRALQSRPEVIGPAALQRAANLLRETGFCEDAVSLFAECKDWTAVAEIAAAESDRMHEEGRTEMLASWLDLLPPALLQSDPRLLLASAASRVHSSPRNARHLFQKAYDGFEREGDRRGMTRSAAGVIRLIILESDDLAALDPWIEKLAGLLQERGPENSTATVALVWAMSLRDLGNQALETWLDRAERDAGAGASSLPGMRTQLARATVATLRGDFGVAESVVGSLPPPDPIRNPKTFIELGFEASLRHLLDHEFVPAREAAAAALKIVQAEGIAGFDACLRAIAGMAALGVGDCESARTELLALQGSGAKSRRGDRVLVHTLRSALADVEGDSALALRESRAALTLAIEFGMPWLECWTRIAAAQLQAPGDRRGAEGQLRSAAALAEQLCSPLLLASVRAAEAVVAAESGDEHAALEPLRQALAIVRQQGFRYLAGMRPQRLATLCVIALSRGIEAELVRVLVRSSGMNPPPAASRLPQWPWQFHVSVLGRFRLLRDQAPIESSPKGIGRPVELLKVLISLGGRDVRWEQIADSMWPQAEDAKGSFNQTLKRTRDVLEDHGALLHGDRRLSLNPELVWVDLWGLDQCIQDIEALLAGPRGAGGDLVLKSRVAELLALYQGPVLPDESEQPCYIACREQTRARMLRTLNKAARCFSQPGEMEMVTDWYLRCIDVDERCEGFYRYLMLLYKQHGERLEASAVYERLRSVLSTRCGIMPSADTQAIYASLQTAQN